MAPGETRIGDIPTEIQKHMFKLLATNNGAKDFVRATASCKRWKEFAEDADILKAMKFDSAHKIDKWEKNGLLLKCANADNKGAADIIACKKHEDMLRNVFGINPVHLWHSEGVKYKPDPPVPEWKKGLRRTDSIAFFRSGNLRSFSRSLLLRKIRKE